MSVPAMWVGATLVRVREGGLQRKMTGGDLTQPFRTAILPGRVHTALNNARLTAYVWYTA